MKERFNKFLNTGMNKGLSWTTIASEKLLLALIGISTCIASAMYLYEMILQREILLGDLFMLFIYAEILAMVGAFYSTNRIPVTLPIIVAITALCRLIIMQTKENQNDVTKNSAWLSQTFIGAVLMPDHQLSSES